MENINKLEFFINCDIIYTMTEKLNLVTNNDGGKPGAVISMEKEIIELASLKQENLELREKVIKQSEGLNNLERIFSITTHDIRNSLSQIVGFTDFLSAKSEEEIRESASYVGIIKNAVGTSLDLINELSGWVKLQANNEKGEARVIDLKDQIFDATGSLLGKIEEKKININNNVENNTQVVFDVNILNAVIRNIVSNAVKFTPEGGNISISSKEINNLIKIYIKDNGVGLSPEKISKLFKAPVNSGMGTNRETGMGIALYFCKELISKNGGNIEVESGGEGEGATFIVTIPKELKENNTK